MASVFDSQKLIFYVNGKKIIERSPHPAARLLGYLRHTLQLTGSKQGCGEGGCGACTVMVSSYDPYTKNTSHRCVYACMTPLCSLHGMAVTTVEGVGNSKKLHPVQERLAKSHGSQCGYCSPGMVMSMYTLLRNNPNPSKCEIEEALKGNLCRCTGYRAIVEGFQTFAKGVCCGNLSECPDFDNHNRDNTATDSSGDCGSELYNKADFAPRDPSQELIFPPELKLNEDLHLKSATFAKDGMIWMRPTSLDELLQMKSAYPNSRLVAGYLEIGLEITLTRSMDLIMISVTNIPEFNSIDVTEKGITFGSSVTLASIYDALENKLSDRGGFTLHIMKAILETSADFGQQALNRSGIGSHIMTANSCSDLIPIMAAGGCTVNIISSDGCRRSAALHPGFFLGNRTTSLKENEILLSVVVPFTDDNEYCHGFKVAKLLHRREDNVSMVNAGMYVSFEPDTLTVVELRLIFGGIATALKSARRTEFKLRRRTWNEALLNDALSILSEDLPITGQSAGYRQALIMGFFFKFFWSVLKQVSLKRGVIEIPEDIQSITEPKRRIHLQSKQSYQKVSIGQLEADVVGRPVMHHSAYQQVTGEAYFCDDIPVEQGELHMALVLSTRSHAKIISIDASRALQIKGVRCFVGETDVPGDNLFIFADTSVTYIGQPIGAIVAIDRMTAIIAVKLVNIDYEDLVPILTLQESIALGTFGEDRIEHNIGNVDEEFEKCEHVMDGKLMIGSQEHFYMETHACICRPRENDEIEVICTTQAQNLTQTAVAKALKIPLNKVTCKVKRLGGCFGGKLGTMGSFASATAVAARKVQKPVRLVLSRDDDMKATTRNIPMMARYKVGYSGCGRLCALDITIYGNAGAGLSVGVPKCNHGALQGVEQAIMAIDNVYNLRHLRATGIACLTNVAPFGPMRGFGTPQGNMFIESVINDIAVKCSMPQVQIRELNMYSKTDDFDHMRQVLNQAGNIRRCWDECLQYCGYHERRTEIDYYNRSNRWKKRGIAIVPCKRKVGYPGGLMNQGSALVNVYTDGTVLVTHGGVEMGQGLHTKITQVASRVLSIPTDHIYVSESSTDKVPNASSTGASSASDLYCTAVKIACEQLQERLEPFMVENPKASWEDLVASAYKNRVSLSAVGFYKPPGDPLNWRELSGHVGYYFVYGCACSEVEIDCLTGDFEILRADIVMDAGESLSPAIDIGQVEGGFVQGFGMFVLEDERRSVTGELLTLGPGLYRIPRVQDIPQEFNVHLLKEAPNNLGVCSSKNVGEPPLFLGSSIYFAIKDAIYSARAEAGVYGVFRLDCPATMERIRMACIDNFTTFA